MDKYGRRIVFNGVIALFAVIVMITVAVLCTDTALSEKATRTVTFAFTNSLGRLSSALPFSLFETLAFIAAAVALLLIIKFIVLLAKRKFRRGICAFTTLAATVLCVVSVYMLDTSFAYNREKPPLDILQNGEISKDEALQASEDFIADFIRTAESLERDANYFPVCTLSVSEMSDMIAAEYAKLTDDYYGDYVPRAKSMAFSGIMSEAHLTGITFTPIGEANVNDEDPITDRIFTIAHETAHAIGIMREEDANLVAAYVLINSSDDLLRYSAMYEYYGRMLEIIKYYGGEKRYSECLDALRKSVIAKEAKSVNEFWQSKGGIFSKISAFFNDLYLKVNGQNLGTGSYDDSNFSDVTQSDPDEDGNVTYEITLSDVQLTILTYYCGD